VRRKIREQPERKQNQGHSRVSKKHDNGAAEVSAREKELLRSSVSV